MSATDGAEAGATAITVTLTSDAPVIGDQTVDLLASGLGITAGDYALTDGDAADGIQIKILDGQTTGTVVFTAKDDLLNEGAELVTLAISDPSQGLVLGDTTTQDITIADDDDAGTSNYVLPEAGAYRLALNGDTLEISDILGTIVATRALGVDPLVINGTAGDDTLIVDFSSGNITVPITFNGGEQSSEIGDAVTVVGTPELTATALPSPTTEGEGTITVGDFGVVNFTGLEPTDLIGFGVANVTFTGADDVISIDHASIPTFGAALSVSGTSAGGAFETFRLKNNTIVNIDTTTVDGTADVVTIEKANNAHGNTNLIINTGTGGGATERIDIEGPTTFTGNVTLTSARININDVLTAGAGRTVTLTANVGGITDGNGAALNIAAGNLVASAVTGIGTADALETTVANLEASGGTGGVNVADTDSLTIGGISAATGVSATGGNITITTTGALTVNEAVTNTGGGNITLTAGPTGNQNANQSDDLQLNASVQASGGNGDVVLNASSDITQSGTVTAAGGGDLDYNAGTNTNNGMISMAGASVASTPNGQVTMDADGNISVGAISAATALITSTAGAIVDANGASNNIAAAATVLLASQGIGAGDAIETSVANLEASGGSGGVNVANTGNLTIGGVGPTTGVSATGGNITLTSTGALALGESVTNSAGGVTLSASGALSSVAGATLSSTTGATVTSGASGTLAGVIAGAGGFTYQGSSVLTLTAANTYGGVTTITGGTLLVNGSIATPSVAVQSGATLGGSGSVAGTVAVQNGGAVAPGSSPGILSTGRVSLVSGSTFKAEVNGTTAGTSYDQLAVTGTVTLGGATLNVSGTIASPSASPIVLISNDSTDAVSGTFAGLAEGAVLMINGIPFTISYVGGSGNDVVLRSQATVNLSVSAAAGTEAGSTAITVTATANAAVGGNQTLDLGVSGTHITAGDYTLSNNIITILSGQTSGSVTFTVNNDRLLEGAETATLTISNPSAGLILGPTTTQNVGITDNEDATLAIAATSSATEAGGAQSVGVVTLTIGGTGTGTVALGDGISLTADVVNPATGSATSGADYTAFGTQTVTFDNGALSGATRNTTLSPVNDRLLEGNETVNLTLQNLGGSAVSKALGNTSNVTTITDDESATLAIAATSSATETGGGQTVGAVTLTITGSGTGTFALGSGISVTADVVDAGTGTASSGADYAAFGTQTVTFSGGAVTGATRNATLTPTNDRLLEGSETVNLTLQNLGGSPVAVTPGNTSNVTTITDDESATLDIATTSSVTEQGGAQSVGVVTLTIGGTGTGTVALGAGITLSADVVDAVTGTATSGTDYTAFGPQTVTFNAGALNGATRNATLAPVDDTLLESSETVALTLQNLSAAGVNAALGDVHNVTTITDNESATLAIASTATVTEQGGAQNVGVTLTITGSGSGGTFALGDGISLTADVVDPETGSASSGADYTAFGSQTVTFNNGAASGTTQNVSLSPVNDKLLEGAETVNLTLQALGGSAVSKALGNTSNVTTITDDESATLAIAATSTAAEQGGDQSVGVVTLTITGSGSGTFALGDGISLTADVVDAGNGTAISGTDYTAFGTQTVTFNAGAVTGATQSTTLTPVNDLLLEGSETVKLTLQNLGASATNTTLGNANNVTTITDNESATLAIAPTSGATEDGGTQSVGVVTLTINGTGTGSSALGTGITLTADVVDAGTGTATSGTDYTAFATQQVTFTGGTVSGATRNTTLTPTNDTLLEGSETVALTLQNLGGAPVDKSFGNVNNVTTITDDESATLAIAATTTVTEQGGAQNVGVTLTITGSGSGTFTLGDGITLTADVVDQLTGTAISGTDYAAFGPETVTFNNGAASGTTRNVSLSPVNDTLLEGSETVKLKLQNLGATAVNVALGNVNNTTTITDDESATLAIAPTATVTEQGGAQNVGVTLTITGSGTGTYALGTGISLTADVVDQLTGTAISGTDYVAFGTQTVTFDNGAASGATQNVSLSPVNDTLLETSETVKLKLQNLGGSAVAKSLGNVYNTTTITDDESATLAIAATSSVTEAGGAQSVGAVTLTITGSGIGTYALGSGISLTADVVDAGGGTATSGTDYATFSTQTVTFNGGAATGTTQNVSLNPVSDTLLEGSETVKLKLQNLGGSAVAKSLGNTYNTTTITDDESATLAIATTSSVTEQGGAQPVGVVTLTIVGNGSGTFALGSGISLTANVVDAGTGTATSATDYTAFGTQAVIFNGGAVTGATQSTTLTSLNDRLLEGSETVQLTLQDLGGSAVSAALGNTSNTTTIADDESATLAIASAATVTEPGGAQNVDVTLTITGTGSGTYTLGNGISLTADVVDQLTGTAISVTDYAAFGTQTVMFDNGAVSGTTQNVSLTPENDTLLEGSETVKLKLQNLGGSAVAKSLGTIYNTTTITDDESATLAIAATSTATEAGGAQSVGVVTLAITGSGTGTYALGPGITLTAQVVDAGGGTASATDYSFATQTMAFDSGAATGTTKSVSLSPVSDNLVEPNETVNLKLQYLGGSAVTKSFGNTSNVTTITDDDTATAVDPASVQYSDKVNLSATITTGAPASLTGTVKFSIYAGGVWTQVASAAVNSVNATSVTVNATTSQILLAPGNYSYKAEFCSTNSAYNGSVDTDTLTVTQENALATYVGPTYVSTPNATATTAIVPLQATIVDINDVTTGGLGLRGNVDNDNVTNLLTNARVTFTVYDAATNAFKATFENVAVNLLNPADPTVGTALASWSADIGSADAVTYRVHTVVYNYYTRDTVLDDELVTVAKPLDNSITGGGYIINTDSAGLYAADDGSKTNFGFNVKLNKSGTNPQGKVNIIFRRLEDDGIEHIYQIKSTAISSVGVNATDGTSTFLSKATLTDVTNPSAPISIPGPFDLTIRTDDNGEPGTGSNNKGTDSFSVSLFKGAELWFSTNFSGGVQSQLQVLDGGNIRNNPNNERLLYFVNSASTPTAPGDQTTTEGDTGYKNMVFTVRLSQASTQTVTVNYTTADGTALAGSDYCATSGTLTFAPGVTTATFTVQVKGDLLAESDELFYVKLSGASGAGIQDPIAMGIIADNEPQGLHVTGGPNVGGQVGDDLKSAMLTPVVTAAMEFWAAQGMSAADLTRLAGTTIRIEDLGGSLLGEAQSGIVTLDDDAAGYGWSTSLAAVDQGEVDLFSVVVHEFGHVLGLTHNVLDPDLAVGARELPALVPTAQPAPSIAGNTILTPPVAPEPQPGVASLAKAIEWHVERAAAPGLPPDLAWVPSLIDWHVDRAGAQSQSESVDVPSLIDWTRDVTEQTAPGAKVLRPWLLVRL